MASPFQHIRGALARRCLGTITEFRTSEPVIALTFDDGPDNRTTPQVLEILARHDARATFFVIGQAASAAPALLRRIAAAGHAIANHTWDHRSMAGLPRRERRRQIKACARAIFPYGSRLFRPPWGDQTRMSRIDALALRHKVIGWSVDVDDWCNGSARSMTDRLNTTVVPGSIILLHDHMRSPANASDSSGVHHSRDAMLEALDAFLGIHHSRFRCMTLPEMFRHGSPVRRYWFQSPRPFRSTELPLAPSTTIRV